MQRTNDSQSGRFDSINRRKALKAVGGSSAALLAGCGGLGGGGGSKKVKFLTMGVGDNIKDFFNKNNKKFEKQTGIKVEFESITWGQAQSTLQTRVQGGKAPDTSRLPSRWIPQFQAMDGAIASIDDFMSGDFEDKFYPKVAATAKVDGKYFGIPWAYSNKAFYYNKDVFKKAGLDPKNPKLNSWSDMLAAAKQIKENADTPAYGLPAGDRLTTASQFLHYLWSFGGAIVNDQGKPVVNSKAAVNALTFYKNLVTKHGVTQSSPLSSTRHDVRNLFEQGNVAMHIGHVYVGLNIKNNNTGVNFEIVQVPKGPAGRYSLATTDSLVMYSSSKRKDAVKKLWEFYYDTDRRFQYSKQKGFMPVVEAVGEKSYFSESPIWSPFLEASKYARSRPKLRKLNSILADDLVTAIQQAIAEKKTPKAALDAAQQKIKKKV